MFEWLDDLKISGTDIYLDSRRSRPLCIVSHAHGDHLGEHERAIATPETAALAEHRIGLRDVRSIPFHSCQSIDEDHTVELRSAGHVLGSAMVCIKTATGSLLYTGDFKLRRCLTVPVADPMAADVLVMESTYGLPFFRFPHRQLVVEQLCELVEQALRAGHQPLVYGYTLGKSQEITRILSDAGFAVTAHGAVYNINSIYERFGVSLGRYRKYAWDDFHGERQLDLRERGVLVAPPNAARSPFTTRFENPCRIILTGWAMLKNSQYRYGVDHALPLSDHADFDELLELVERVRPRKIFTHHGYPEFAETLRMRGHDAQTARPDPQLQLF